MATEIKVPVLPESVADGIVASWHVKVGDTVAVDDNLVDIETEKVVLEVPSSVAGTVTELRVEAGDTVNAEQVIAVITEGDSAASSTEKSTNQVAEMKESTESSGTLIEVKVPVLPESVAEGTLVSWHKAVGDAISADDNLVDIETEKVVLEVPSPVNGILKEIKVDSGSTVQAEQLLAVIEEGITVSKPAVAPSSNTAQTSSDAADKSGPAVRKMISETGVDTSTISGSGKDGRLTKTDVSNAASNNSVAVKPTESETAEATTQSLPEDRVERREPMSRIRSTIARRLKDAQNTQAMLTTFNDVDLSAVMDLRKQYKESFEKKHDARLGFMSFFAKASVEALKRFPAVNASIDGNDIVYHDYQDIGIAASSPRGLVVPVLRSVDQMSFADIEKKISEYGAKAKSGKLSLAEMEGGTFTITNGGVFGSMLSTPIVNPPQSAILGMHRIEQRPIAVNSEVVIRPMMYLALTYDHRIIDGAEAVRFLVTIKECLEDPARLLLEV